MASTAIYGLLSVPGTTATVLGTSGHAVWLLVNDDIVVVSTSDATRLPNGVQIAATAADDAFRMVHHGAEVQMGFGRIMLEGLTVNVVRWWDPRPVLREISPSMLAAAIEGLPSEVPDVASQQLRAALSTGSPVALLAAAKPMLGKGPGLTPEGDDYLAGALAATRLLGTAVASTTATTLLASIAVHLARLADARTTTFSAALLRNALRGQVVAPAASLLRAFTGRGDVAPAHRVLSAVGHSSGPALAAGIVLGAQALIAQSAK
ncbi:MAG: DUF2877 domain-containing protein [Actinomycetota bacterium]|nr:DUF2877 domain-containing protein [Actinomycetota bacterium]